MVRRRTSYAVSGVGTAFKKLKLQGIHQTAETALFVERGQVETALKYLDLFIVDIKILDKDKCRKILGGNIHVYMDNVKEIFKRKNGSFFAFR